MFPGDVDQMTAACLRILSDEKYHETLRQNARQAAIEKFPIDKAVNQYIESYREAIEIAKAEDRNLNGGKLNHLLI